MGDGIGARILPTVLEHLNVPDAGLGPGASVAVLRPPRHDEIPWGLSAAFRPSFDVEQEKDTARPAREEGHGKRRVLALER